MSLDLEGDFASRLRKIGGRVLDNRIKIFTSLPLQKRDRLTLTKTVRDIGTAETVPSPS